MRFYLLDKVIKVETDYAEGIKCWSLDNEIFNEHFPAFPIVPGALLLESMAQLSGFLINIYFKQKLNKNVFALLSIVHKAKFIKFVEPGDQTTIKATLQNIDADFARTAVKLFVKNKEVANAIMSFYLVKEKIDKTGEFSKKMIQYYNFLTKNL